MTRDKQLEWEYLSIKSLGNTTREPDQLVHVVRPDAASRQEGRMGTVIGKQVF